MIDKDNVYLMVRGWKEDGKDLALQTNVHTGSLRTKLPLKQMWEFARGLNGPFPSYVSCTTVSKQVLDDEFDLHRK